MAQSAIGQRDVALTPLQVAMIAAAVANNGVLMKPYLVREVQAPDLTRAGPHRAGGAVHRGVAGGGRAS